MLNRTSRYRILLVVAGVCALAAAAATSALAGKSLKTKSKTDAASSAEYAEATAKCKRGTRAVSGGFEAEPPDAGPSTAFFEAVDQSSRTGGRRWTAEGLNLGNEAGDLTAFAYCRDQKLKTRKATTSVGPGEAESVTARCKRGTTALSGGFDGEHVDIFNTSDTPWFWVMRSVMEGKRKWTVEAFNGSSGGVAGDLTASVVCGEGGALKAREADATQFAPALGIETVEAECRRRERVVSGGFDLGIDWQSTGSWPNASHKVGKRGWHVESVSAGGAQHSVTAFAYCEKK
jgi:hypothetical protein